MRVGRPWATAGWRCWGPGRGASPPAPPPPIRVAASAAGPARTPPARSSPTRRSAAARGQSSRTGTDGEAKSSSNVAIASQPACSVADAVFRAQDMDHLEDHAGRDHKGCIALDETGGGKRPRRIILGEVADENARVAEDPARLPHPAF